MTKLMYLKKSIKKKSIRMKKTIKLVSFLCVLTLLINCVCSFNVSAITKDRISSVSFSESDSRVNALPHPKNVKLNINSSIELYDTNENTIALAYKLSPTGYVIMDNDSNIIEYSFTLNLPFSLYGKQPWFVSENCNMRLEIFPFALTANGFRNFFDASQ